MLGLVEEEEGGRYRQQTVMVMVNTKVQRKWRSKFKVRLKLGLGVAVLGYMAAGPLVDRVGLAEAK